jgi:nicotinate phosphoribosyltransferase
MHELGIVGSEDVRAGRATDAYFERTEEALAHADHDPHVVAEVTADQFADGEFEVFAGLPDAAAVFAGQDVTVHALPEGQLFDGGPVLRVSGRYREFARLETALLGVISHASGIATNTLEAVRAAGDVPVLSFGTRHVHPSLATVVERSALVGGADGVSNVAAADALGRDAQGTMPHALVLAFGYDDQEAAWRAFDEGVADDVPRIALCDTFDDEVVEVRRAVAELGDDLDGVRLDTTGSRRGDFRHIVREVRWLLEDLGRPDVDVFLSGGLDPTQLRELRDVADGFGVGSHISNADPIDFALDVVEVEGDPISKRGKLAGVKEVFRDGDAHVVERRATTDRPLDDSLLEPLVDDGEVVREFDVDEAAERALEDAARVRFDEEEE